MFNSTAGNTSQKSLSIAIATFNSTCQFQFIEPSLEQNDTQDSRFVMVWNFCQSYQAPFQMVCKTVFCLVFYFTKGSFAIPVKHFDCVPLLTHTELGHKLHAIYQSIWFFRCIKTTGDNLFSSQKMLSKVDIFVIKHYNTKHIVTSILILHSTEQLARAKMETVDTGTF